MGCNTGWKKHSATIYSCWKLSPTLKLFEPVITVQRGFNCGKNMGNVFAICREEKQKICHGLSMPIMTYIYIDYQYMLSQVKVLWNSICIDCVIAKKHSVTCIRTYQNDGENARTTSFTQSTSVISICTHMNIKVNCSNWQVLLKDLHVCMSWHAQLAPNYVVNIIPSTSTDCCDRSG